MNSKLTAWRARVQAWSGWQRGEASPPAGAMGLAAIFSDLALFEVLFAAGLRLSPAHVVSFAAASALNYFLRVRHTVTADSFRSHAKWLAASVMALCLRGGVLALFVQIWQWPAQVAIIPAIGASAAMLWFAETLGWSLRVGSGGVSNQWQIAAVALVAYGLALRFIYLGLPELLPEEAYYWNYSRHLDIGYLDHPPMVAWLIRLGTMFFGQNEFGIRIGAFGCWLVTAFFVYRLTRNLFNEPSAFVAVLLLQALPFFFSVGLLMTPDAPLTVAWAGTLYYLERALLADRRKAWWGVGVCMGLGMISKYSIGLLGLAMVIFFITDRQSRRWLFRLEPYVATLVGLLIFSPVVVWNSQHGWASFAFQSARRLAEKPKFSLFLLLGSMLVLVTPTGLVAAAMVLFGKTKERITAVGRDDPASRRRVLFVRVFTLAPLSVFVLFSLRHVVKLEWTGPVWLAVLPAIASAIVLGAQSATRAVNAWWLPTMVLMMLIYGVGFHYLVLGLPGFGYSKQMLLLPVGWRDLARQVGRAEQELEKEVNHPCLIVGMSRNFIASELAFYRRDHEGDRQTTGPHLFGQNSLMYEFWFPQREQVGKAALLVSFSAGDLDRDSVEKQFQRLGPVQEITVTKDGRVIRPFFYRCAYGYRGLPVGS